MYAPLLTGIVEEDLLELCRVQLEASPQLSDLESNKDSIKSFLSNIVKNGRRLAIITSGGTTVPIERKTVRFIDNFSTGLRGARLAEYFFENDYDVIFLHRTGSSFPYLHRIMNHNDPLASLSRICENSKHVNRQIFDKRRFIAIEFTQIFEYLSLLYSVLVEARKTGIGSKCFVCLAAAVSDFFVPVDLMPENKIQSREIITNDNGDVILCLKHVPKALELVKKRWFPEAFILSFKLETDHEKLITKSLDSIRLNGVDAVLANQLQNRYSQVNLLSQSGTLIEDIKLEDQHQELDRDCIGPRLITIHAEYISKDHDRFE